MDKHSISIWFFIGSLLTFYGALILASGIYALFVPTTHPVTMSNLHIEIWWGAGMLLLGLVYILSFPAKSRR